MPPAARSLDLHICSMHPIPLAPTSGIIEPRTGKPTVNIGHQPAARQGDKVRCVAGGMAGTILSGEPTVRIEGKPAARMTDRIGHLNDPITGLGVPSGMIEIGCPTVNIGSSTQAEALRAAAEEGTAFCEACERARKGATAGEEP